jgi:xanthine dehydrogenase YagT iron-sulfur-binding subunit
MTIAVTGRPSVLAFVRAWNPVTSPPGEQSAMRAQLRGLGAVLIILSDAGTWSFRPDDDLERFAAGDADAIGDAEAIYNVSRDQDAVFVLDADGKIRFSHVCDGALATSLASALEAAGAAVVARPPPITFTRREWAISSLVTGFALALFGCKSKQQDRPAPAPDVAPPLPPPVEYEIVLDVNGVERKLKVEARVSLLDALRERLGLTGTKKGCDHGQCGACTVHADGRRILSCMTLAVMAQGQKLATIEGLANGDELHPMQAAFVEKDALQCGYCTPGQIMSAVALLAEGRASSDEAVRESMSGNICRCGAYPNIVAAIQAARKGA